MLQWRNGVYEIFEYIGGQGYPQTLEGHLRLRPHPRPLPQAAARPSKPTFSHPSGSYHLGTVGRGRPATDPDHSRRHEPGKPTSPPLLNFLLESYRYSADIVEQMGPSTPGPRQIVHARLAPGQHALPPTTTSSPSSITTPPASSPAIVRHRQRRPPVLDHPAANEDVQQVARLHRRDPASNAFLRGYDEVMLLSQAEIRTIPYLMGRGP